MENEQIYEKPRIRNRFKDLATLAFFTIGVGIVSIIIMDLLVFPLSYLAINHTEVFTLVVQKASISLVYLLLLAYIVSKIYKKKKDGFTTKQIISAIFYRPFYYFSVSFFILLLTAIIVSVLYYILSNNDHLLYRLSI